MVLAAWLVAFGCGGETNEPGHVPGSGGQIATGGATASTGGSKGMDAAGGRQNSNGSGGRQNSDGSGGRQNSGGSGGRQNSAGAGGAIAGGSGGMSAGGSAGSGGNGSGGRIICPPCAAPPHPGCVGEGPCGCGPYTCPDGGNGEFCGGAYRRQQVTARCPIAQPVLWEAMSGNIGQFSPPACKDIGTDLPRFCCTNEFTPVCPG